MVKYRGVLKHDTRAQKGVKNGQKWQKWRFYHMGFVEENEKLLNEKKSKMAKNVQNHEKW